MAVVPGNEGYEEQADSLFETYESVTFEAVHRDIRPLLPAPPARILDIGAGSGRDAAALAALGHRVVAVEPTAAMRRRAVARHATAAITWIDDGLPDLARLESEDAAFDAVLATAVWMHLDKPAQARAMPRLAHLLRPGGLLALTIRHGPVPEGRRMYAIDAAETVALAAACGLDCLLRLENRASVLPRPDITWTRLAFRAPDLRRAADDCLFSRGSAL